MILLSRFLISIAELYLIMEPRLSPYEILQISEQSSADEIRERYLVMSRTFHPDKQPLENWNITKKYFESIDKAYKSISTELRKYIYFKFGVDGIDLLERYPDEFATLEGKENTPEGKQQIDQMVFHFYFSDRRDYLDDQGKVQSTTVIDISLLFQKFSQGVPLASYRVPTIPKIHSVYMLAGPTVLGFQHNLIAEFNSGANRKVVAGGIASTRRIVNKVLFKNVFGYSTDGLYQSTAIEYLHSPTLLLRFTPITYVESKFLWPKLELEKRFENGMTFTADTNLGATAFQLYFPGKQPTSMNASASLNYARDSFQPQLNFDFHLSDFSRLIVQLRQDYAGQQVALGISYGIVVDMFEDTKVTLLSHLSSDNHFQIKIVSGKYNIKLPIVCTTLQWSQFETLKISAIFAFYAGCRVLNYFRRTSTLKKEKLKIKSFARLNDQSSKFKVSVAEISSREEEITKFQYQTGGLVILAAYVGNQRQVRRIAKKIRKKNKELEAKINSGAHPIPEIRSQLQFQSEQVINVTKKVQMLVKGARIQNAELKVYNPCYDETQKPILYIYYSLRGKRHTMFQPASKEINIGLEEKRYSNFITNAVNWLRKVHLIP